LEQLRAYQRLLASIGVRKSLDALDEEWKLLARQYAWRPRQHVLGDDTWAESVYAPHRFEERLIGNRSLAAKLLSLLTSEQRQQQAETQVEMYRRKGATPPASVEELIAEWEQLCAEAGGQ